MPESPSDSELIAGCIEGRKESWDIFVDRFSKLIYWSIHRTLESYSFKERSDLIHDIFQDFFGKFLEKEKLRDLRSASSVRKFLTVMACHATIDKLKALSQDEKKNDLYADIGSQPNSRELDPRHAALADERDLLIAEALEGLSRKERLCIEWHYLEGKTHRETSEILGISQDAVSTILRRTKDKLRKLFLKKGLSG